MKKKTRGFSTKHTKPDVFKFGKATTFQKPSINSQDPELHQAAHAPFGDPLQEWPSRSSARCSPWPLGDAMVTPTCSPYILFTH